MEGQRRTSTGSPTHIGRLREILNEEVRTRRKHLLITAAVAFVIFGLISYQVANIQSSLRDDDLQAQALDVYSAELRAYDAAVIAYQQCLSLVESREIARDENERDSNVLVDIVRAIDRVTGPNSDDVIAELYAVIERGRQAANDARPSFAADFCQAPPIEPTRPHN